MGVSGPRSSGTGQPGSPPRSSTSSPETKSAQRPKSAASSMRSRTSSPPSRGRSGRERRRRLPTSVTRRRDHALAAATAVEVDRPTWPKVAEELRFDLDRLRASPRTRLPTGFTSRPRRRSTRASRRCVSGPGWRRGLSRDRPVSPSPTHSSASSSCVRMRPSERGLVESDRETEGSPPERRAGPIQKFGGSSFHRNVFASERGRSEQVNALRAPLERAVVRLKSWKIIRHDDE